MSEFEIAGLFKMKSMLEQQLEQHYTAGPTLAAQRFDFLIGEWNLIRNSFDEAGEVVFEGTAAVGDKPAESDNSNDELFPHLQGGIHPSAVLAVHAVQRTPAGEFLGVQGVTE